MPVLQHPFPARVAGLQAQSSSSSGSGAFLDCYARGWMQGGMGKGEKMDWRGIKRQAKKKENRKQAKTKQEKFSLRYYTGVGWDCWIPHNFTPLSWRDVTEQMFFILTRRLCPEANASWLHSGVQDLDTQPWKKSLSVTKKTALAAS